MYKKTLSLILILTIALLSLCACAAGDPESSIPSDPSSASDSDSSSPVADSSDMAEVIDVVEEGMIPVAGSSLNDGVYSVTVDSSSSMFKITDCQLTVENGKMTALMTMSGTGYLYLYMGTGEAAANADEKDYIPFAENENGEHTFTVPVEALDVGIPCAAFSKRKELWYDRTLLFRADSLPLSALKEGSYKTPEDLNLSDGTYTVEVALEGGSGRASVSSPAVLTVESGKYTAEIIWSSSKYDYMIVGEEKLLPVNTEGNSTFIIPVSVFDRKMPVLADTTAMSEAHEIEYTLFFKSESIQKES